MGVISSLSGNNVRRIEQFIRFCGQLVLNGFWTSLRKPQQNKLFSRPSNALATFFSTEAILLVTLSVGLADGATVGSRVGLGTYIIVDYSDSRGHNSTIVSHNSPRMSHKKSALGCLIIIPPIIISWRSYLLLESSRILRLSALLSHLQWNHRLAFYANHPLHTESK